MELIEEVSMKKLFALVLIILALAAFSMADIYIKSKAHTDPVSMMGQSRPATDTITEQWIGDDVFASVSEKISTIVDLKKNLMNMIYPQDKTYIEATLPLDMSKLLPQEMAAMASMMKVTVTVAPNGQTKKVGQWNCAGYDVAMTMMGMPMKMMVWATSDVPFDMDKYMEKMYGNVIKAQMMLDDAAILEMKKVKGFWIASEMNMEMMGQKMHTTTEVVEISKKSAPAGTYSVPAGYTKQDKLSMKQMQQK
jgi:hypothetical protein